MGRSRLRSAVFSWPAAAVAVIVLQGILSSVLKPGQTLSSYTLIPYFILLVLATVIASVNALQRTLGQRPFWAFLAVGFGLWALDSWLWIYYELILRQKIPDSSIADPALFLHVVPFLAALATRPELGEASLRRHQTTLNFLLLLLFWVFLYAFLVFPFQFLPANSTIYNLRYNVLYFGENLALIATLGALLLRADAPWKSLYWHMLGATGVYVTASLIANTAIDLGGYYPGHWTDFVILIAICWFVWIPLRARQLEPPTRSYVETKAAGLQGTTVLAMLVVLMIPGMSAWDLSQTEDWWMHRIRILVGLCFMTLLALAAFIKRYAENRELKEDVLLSDEKRLKSQQRFLELLESVDAIVWEADAATLRVTFVSRGAERILGFSRLQWIQTPAFWADHLHPDDRDRALACESEVLEKGKALSVEYRMLAADGRYLWFRDFMHSVPGPHGKAERLRGIMVDITASHQAEEALRENEDRYRDLVENSQDLICTHDLTGKLLSVNPTPAKILGYSPEELLKIPMRDLLAPEVRKSFDVYLETIRREGAAQGLLVVQTRSGEKRIWEYSNTLRTKGVSEPIVRGMARDVTERHQAEKALRETQTRLELITRASNTGLWDWDLRTNTVYYSPEWKNQIGYAEDEISNRFEEWESRVHPEDLAGAIGRVRDFLANPQGEFENEFRFRHKDGSYRWILARASVLKDNEGKPCRMLGSHLDVTERKRGEEALRESEARFRSYFELPLIGIAITSPEKGWVEVNDQMCSMMGYSREELLRMTWPELTHPADLAADVEQFNRILTCQINSYTMDKRFIRKNGEVVWTSIAVGCVRDSGGRVKHIVALGLDISERKRVEEALAASETRYRTLFEQSPVGVLTVDLESGLPVEFNDVAARQLGYSREEFARVRISDYEALATPERTRQRIDRIMREGGDGFETQHRTKTGEIRDVAVTVRLIELRGRTLGNCVFQDITERKQAERALQESEGRYRLLAENVTDVIWIADLDLRYMYISPAVLPLRGVTVEEAMSQMIEETLTASSLQIARKALAEELSKEANRQENPLRSRMLELEQTCKDGSTVWTEVRASFLRDPEGRPSGLLGITRDISERKQAEQERMHLEEQLRQAQKMEAVGRLAGGVAHDFNNLLTAINGYSQLLLKRVESTGTVHDFLARILKAGDRAASLTQQLLAFSRKQVIEPRVLDLNTVLENMDKLLRRLIGEDVELATIPGVQLGQVRADPTQIEQVIMNLVVNARDAMPRGGKLTIESKNAELDESYASTHVDVTPGHYVMLAVSDSGHGMDAETLAHAFEPFFTTKEQGKGTGLGLSTVYGIVKQTGGHVGVYSEVGKGTTFKIYLPRLNKPVELAEEREDETGLSGSETILLVEDEADVRMFIQMVLENQGYTVILAGSPVEAMTFSEHYVGRIHLLLSDVIMPGFSGKELADHLAFARPDMKVLFISGYTADVIARHGVLDEETQFLQKPFTPIALLRKVRVTIDKADPSSKPLRPRP